MDAEVEISIWRLQHTVRRCNQHIIEHNTTCSAYSQSCLCLLFFLSAPITLAPTPCTLRCQGTVWFMTVPREAERLDGHALIPSRSTCWCGPCFGLYHHVLHSTKIWQLRFKSGWKFGHVCSSREKQQKQHKERVECVWKWILFEHVFLGIYIFISSVLWDLRHPPSKMPLPCAL